MVGILDVELVELEEDAVPDVDELEPDVDDVALPVSGTRTVVLIPSTGNAP